MVDILFHSLRPFYCSQSLNDHIEAIIKFTGKRKLLDYINKFQLPISRNTKKCIMKCFRRRSLRVGRADRPALSLIRQLMSADPHHRLTAENALKHQYFRSLKISNYDESDTENLSPNFNYSVAKCVGRGGFSQVYKVNCNLTKRIFAVKLQKYDFRLHGELNVLSDLQNCPNIIKFFGSFVDVSYIFSLSVMIRFELTLFK